MLSKFLKNKKVVIIAIVIFLAVCLGVIILSKISSEDASNKNTGVTIEQKEDNESDDSSLDVLEADEELSEDTSEASGDWNDSGESDTLENNQPNKTDKKEQPNDKDSNENKNDEESKKDEDVLKDDITWGDIY